MGKGYKIYLECDNKRESIPLGQHNYFKSIISARKVLAKIHKLYTATIEQYIIPQNCVLENGIYTTYDARHVQTIGRYGVRE